MWERGRSWNFQLENQAKIDFSISQTQNFQNDPKKSKIKISDTLKQHASNDMLPPHLQIAPCQRFLKFCLNEKYLH